MTKKKSDELAIDFSKVLNIFKRPSGSGSKSGKVSHEKASENPKIGSEDEFSLDIKGIWNFLYRYRFVLLILIPIIFSTMLRAQTLYLPQTDEWAENSVQSYLRSQISQQVRQQYPNLPPENLDAITNEEVVKYIESNQDSYKAQVEQVSNDFKSHFQDDAGQTYLLAIDPYQWYRYGMDIDDHGYMGDIRKEGQVYDMHMLAPQGKKINQELHPYVGAYLHNILGPLTGINLMGMFFMLPIILIGLAMIPAFYVGKRLGGPVAGFFSAMIIAMHPAILTRTVGGFSDTDSYTVLFPLLIFWFMILAVDTEDIKKKVGFSAAAGLMVGLFAFAWYGWWYMFDFAVGALIVYLAYHVIMEYFIKKKKLLSSIPKDPKVRNYALVLIVFIIISGIFVTIFASWNSFQNAVITEPISIITLKEAAKITLWPNVYTTVAEMNTASIGNIISTMGGKFYFLIGALGALLILYNSWKDDKRIAYFALIFLWFAGSFYASTKGIRFTLLMVPPYAIGFAMAAAFVYEHGSRWVSKEMNIGKPIVKTIIIIALIMLLVPSYNAAKATAHSEVPSMNDAWHTTLTNIKESSEDDAIINSWWDFGHWFKAIADRAVTFDGASQNSPQAHWIGRTLLTSNEGEAIGILRMLDCGGNKAFDLLNDEKDNAQKSVDVIYEIIMLDKQEAIQVLSEHVSKEKAEEILIYTHCDPPENYFITSEDMVGKAGVWAHFGSWSFDKAKIWRDYRKRSKDKAVQGMIEEFGYSDERAESIYDEIRSLRNEQEANNWISPWPGYISTVTCSRYSNTTIHCGFNVQGQQLPVTINTSKEDAFIQADDKRLYPETFSYINSQEEFVIREYENNTIPYSVALAVKSDSITGIMMSPELAGSMFTRLFYFDGVGLDHFDFFDYQRDVTGLEIYTWKVDWNGKLDSEE
ncbi:hypothetical protein GF345_04910 [Candidatus Woesearchaeota archaeon]|nr:hypothetical protein [Candidatus Woesearchaeota archaeon]